MTITERISNFPEYAKDIKLNYSKILNETTLNKQQLYSVILISSITTKSEELIKHAMEEAQPYLDENILDDIYGAYSIMSMNAIYYRFTHLATEYDYSNIPANLRMQILSKNKISKTDFEILSLAVAVIIGCGKCINSHITVLKESGISNQLIQTIARIAAIINAVSNVMRLIK